MDGWGGGRGGVLVLAQSLLIIDHAYLSRPSTVPTLTATFWHSLRFFHIRVRGGGGGAHHFVVVVQLEAELALLRLRPPKLGVGPQGLLRKLLFLILDESFQRIHPLRSKTKSCAHRKKWRRRVDTRTLRTTNGTKKKKKRLQN